MQCCFCNLANCHFGFHNFQPTRTHRVHRSIRDDAYRLAHVVKDHTTIQPGQRPHTAMAEQVNRHQSHRRFEQTSSMQLNLIALFLIVSTTNYSMPAPAVRCAIDMILIGICILLHYALHPRVGNLHESPVPLSSWLSNALSWLLLLT